MDARLLAASGGLADMDPVGGLVAGAAMVPGLDEGLEPILNLARIDEMGIIFMSLRRRSPALLKKIALLPRSAWRRIELDMPTRKYRTPRVVEQVTTVAGRKLRQQFIQELGHDEPTILLTNDQRSSLPALITRYADAQSRRIFRDLIDMPATVTITDCAVNVHFHRRAHRPIVADSAQFKTPVNIPWWNDLPLTISA